MTELSARLDAAAASLGPLATVGESLGPLCTYKVGGPAALYVEASSVADLEAVAATVGRHRLPVLVVGKGSNMLVADAGFAGLALHLGDAFAGVDIGSPAARPELSVDGEATGGTVVTLGGAGLLPVAARRTAAAGLTGFEWAVGVPGSVGGAVRMNAGGHGSDMAASLRSAVVFDLTSGQSEEWTVEDLELGYRRSVLQDHHLVVSADLVLEPGDVATSEAEISEIVRWRRANQPGGQNAGSVFANPPGDSAGRLIDAAGLKGFRIGTAEVSPKHANFIQADPDGSADDIYQLITMIRRRVAERFGIVLHCENRLIGFEPLEDLEPPEPAEGEGSR
jgi:UDP-N-acetylmuramate dehydrogenase